MNGARARPLNGKRKRTPREAAHIARVVAALSELNQSAVADFCTERLKGQPSAVLLQLVSRKAS